MNKTLGVALAILLMISANARAAPATIELKVAKTQERAFAFGSVDPGRSGERVRVRLFHDTGQGFTRLATRFDTLGSKSAFEVGFPRPTEGRCRFVVVYLHGARPSESVEWPCGIPDFGSGTATFTPGMATADIEIAETSEQQGYGLMYRRHLGAGKGMVFLFPEDTTAQFYMLNTLIPLSIAFIDSANRIIDIQDMAPCEEEPCPLYGPDQAYRSALEVNQGAFARWGVSVGDIVTITRD